MGVQRLLGYTPAYRRIQTLAKKQNKKKVCYPFPAESYLPTSFTYSEPSEVEAQSYVESRSY